MIIAFEVIQASTKSIISIKADFYSVFHILSEIIHKVRILELLTCEREEALLVVTELKRYGESLHDNWLIHIDLKHRYALEYNILFCSIRNKIDNKMPTYVNIWWYDRALCIFYILLIPVKVDIVSVHKDLFGKMYKLFVFSWKFRYIKVRYAYISRNIRARINGLCQVWLLLAKS